MRKLIALAAVIGGGIVLSACGADYPSQERIEHACDAHGGSAFIAQHNPREEEGDVVYIERCKDNTVVVVKP